MGFPYVGYRIPMPKALLDLLELVDYIKFMIMLALFYLGLYVPSDHTPSWEDHMYRLSSTDLPSSLVPLTIMTQPTIQRPDSIKKRLPIVKFAEFIESSGALHKDDDEPVCAVCLSGLESFDEIRELCNCAHAFHVGCLDKWVDQGHMTCPLCRSKLLDEGEEVKGCGDLWVAEGISYLFGDDLVMGEI